MQNIFFSVSIDANFNLAMITACHVRNHNYPYKSGFNQTQIIIMYDPDPLIGANKQHDQKAVMMNRQYN